MVGPRHIGDLGGLELCMLYYMYAFVKTFLYPIAALLKIPTCFEIHDPNIYHFIFS